MMSERATFPQDLLEEGRFLFETPSVYDEKTRNKKWSDASAPMMQDIADRFNALPDFTSEAIEASFKGYLAEKELGFGKVGPSFRLAVTGRGMGPSMFVICAVLGKDEVLTRISKAIEVLG
jgi:glutamyl-tRNA synthetase